MSRFAHLLNPEQQELLARLKKVLTETEQERTNLVQQEPEMVKSYIAPDDEQKNA